VVDGRQVVEVSLPEIVGGRGAVTGKDEVTVAVEVDGVGGEGSGEAGVTELADGYEGGVAKGGEEVSNVGGRGKIWEL
jgi:hypothetical protein